MPGKEQASVVKEEERKKLDMKIEIEDFGPIGSGKITLKPLTVFIGPNISGKTYATTLIYSVFASYTPAFFYSDTPDRASPSPIFVRLGSIPSQEFPELKRLFDGLREGQELNVPAESIKMLTEKFVEKIYQEKLTNEITRLFACRLDELIKIGKGPFALEIAHAPNSIHLICHENRLEVKEYPQLNVSVRLKATGALDYVMRLKSTGGSAYAITYGPGDKQEFLIEIGEPPDIDKELLFSSLVNLISNICAAKMLENVAVKCHYLPAARSGIMQVLKAFAASIMKQFPYVGTERMDLPRLPGTIADFMSSIISLPKQQGPLYQLATDSEKELIQGEIVVTTPRENLYPEIKYRFGDTEIPLYRSSSTVSELAPLFLYLKYRVGPKSILMIEEPEAHLHPRNQRILARLLVRLVREGVNIVITTHSEYLLEQLRNFVLLSKIEPEKRVEKYDYTEEDYLKPDEFAAYLFHYDKKSKGHKIDRVKMTKNGEFSQDEFVNVINALYEETIRLRRDLNDET